MPEPSAEDEALIQQMLLSLLTHRDSEPVREQTELERGRAAKAAEMMGSEYWQGAPMYYEPASTYNYTDQRQRDMYLERLRKDAVHNRFERNDVEKLEDQIYRDVWDQMRWEKMGFPDWAMRPGTPPEWLDVEPFEPEPEPSARK